MSTIPEVNSVARVASGYQQTVDSFFKGRSSYWRDVYRARTLSAFIYRERRSAVLSMVDKLSLAKGSHILEVGCGAGSITIPLAKRGYRVSAVDTVEAMVELTRNAADRAGLSGNVETRSADVYQSGFPSGYFSLVMAVGLFPWLEYPAKALVEMYRVTKSGGYVILTAPNKWCLIHLLDPLCFPALQPLRWKLAETLAKSKVWDRSRPRQYRYSAKQVNALLREAGFHKVAARTLGFGPFTLLKKKLLLNRAGVRLHQKLQRLAGRGFPVIRSCGMVYVSLSQKP
ncbi:MAG TPA: methyltransferase domain-containing protein [Terriglobia bacterium]|nr:methyltransferase domain-containing protein [Terriglobia bacterium]